MTHAHLDEKPFPLLPLIGAAALVLISLVSVAAMRWSGVTPSAGIDGERVIAERAIRFEDAPGGAVNVIDSAGAPIARLAAGEGGFVRATVRVLVRERAAGGAPAREPFLLQRTSVGRLLLTDPVTERRIDLWAFGHDNAAAFDRYFDITNQWAAAEGSATATRETIQ